ncbi:MAG: PAS domain-containing protein [Chloroflexi bacterium]|nr:PAS domain-containing protein [Chloroflexota bacterium]
MVDPSVVLEALAAPVLVLDESGEIHLCNQAARSAFGLPAGSGMHVSVAGKLPGLRDLLSEVGAHDERMRGEITLDGFQTYAIHATPIEGMGLVLLLQDITAHKGNDRAGSEFILDLSHDLRTPLTSIQGYAELLAQVGELTDQQREFVERVRVSVKQVTDLVDNATELSYIETVHELNMAPCDLASLIQEAVDRYRADAANKRLNLVWRSPPEPLTVLGNRPALQLVMSHLLSNAIKYTPHNGTIQVDASGDARFVTVEVADSGIGIPPDQQPQIFDRFFRVDPAEALTPKGTGLGLPIVKSVVERHHGRVWVESQPGEGSRFSFVLPAHAPSVAECDASTSQR